MKCARCKRDFKPVGEHNTLCCNCLPEMSHYLEEDFDNESKFVLRKPEYNIFVQSRYSTDPWILN